MKFFINVCLAPVCIFFAGLLLVLKVYPLLCIGLSLVAIFLILRARPY